MRPTTRTKIQLAEQHLRRVRSAVTDQVDWAELAIFGLHALEAAVDAVSLHFGWATPPWHTARQENATRLAAEHGLTPVATLLADLNEARKSEAYGDLTRPPSLDPHEVAAAVEEYVASALELVDPK